MSENHLKDDKNRGIRAKQLLNDPLMSKALSDIRATLYKKISESEFSQRNEREDCYMMLRAAEMFEGMLKRHINTGKAAEEKLNGFMRAVRRVQEL